MPGVLKMAAGNVTVITRSPKTTTNDLQKLNEQTPFAKTSKRRLEVSNRIEQSSTGRKRYSSKLTGTARRNERERNRVNEVNVGFAKLRDRVPKRGRGRKMSKVDILRSASNYINELQSMLDEADAVSAVINIAALSNSLGDDGELMSPEDSMPLSPSSYDGAPSPDCCSLDGSASSSSLSSLSSLSSQSNANPYGPDDPALMDLATWLH